MTFGWSIGIKEDQVESRGKISSGTAMGKLQETAHGSGYDYAKGSPHIKHYELRTNVSETLQEVIGKVLDRLGKCRVLEVGAGHGTFTDHILAAGAEVEVTEMSRPSAQLLQRRFRNNSAARVTYDPEGAISNVTGGELDVVVCLSVLHHIPDYLSVVKGFVARTSPGGAFVSFQDPLWYPRRTRRSCFAERCAYLSWRLTQGSFRRGLATSIRRTRGVYDESNPSDMVEYHVVRDGVDEQALFDFLQGEFDEVRVYPYWSSQGSIAQSIGHRLCAPNTFAIIATGRKVIAVS
jgi:SAM-dependent methyltransferase